MKSFYSLLLLLPGLAQAQAKIDTSVIAAAEKIIGLVFTPAERDSMQDDLKNSVGIYDKMRTQPIPNDLSYPFSFHPYPNGFTIPRQQNKTSWDLPLNMVLPANTEDWAFLSVAQWAALIKTKKITSEKLTRYFLERLKKWGDTLECVITLTEDLALEQARSADQEMQKGIYAFYPEAYYPILSMPIFFLHGKYQAGFFSDV